MKEHPLERISYLEAKVRGLEASLERCSAELIQVQSLLEADQLLLLARLLGGREGATRSRYTIEGWEETTELTEVEVDDVLHDLWLTVERRKDSP